jgi:hypothetical protein
MENNPVHPKSRFLFVLLLIASNVFSAFSLQAKNNFPGLTPVFVPADSLVIRQKKFMDPCTLNEAWAKGSLNNSYDPHQQLIYEVEIEAGRLICQIDAFHNQALTIIVMDQYCRQMALIDMPMVKKNYLHLDIAAWDCGKYAIMIVDTHGELGFYHFTLE